MRRLGCRFRSSDSRCHSGGGRERRHDASRAPRCAGGELGRGERNPSCQCGCGNGGGGGGPGASNHSPRSPPNITARGCGPRRQPRSTARGAACAGGAAAHDPSTGAGLDKGGTSPGRIGRGRVRRRRGDCRRSKRPSSARLGRKRAAVDPSGDQPAGPLAGPAGPVRPGPLGPARHATLCENARRRRLGAEYLGGGYYYFTNTTSNWGPFPFSCHQVVLHRSGLLLYELHN